MPFVFAQDRFVAIGVETMKKQAKPKKQIIRQNSFTEFLLYTTPDGKVNVEIFLHNENIWLTQAKIAELFGVKRPAITKHLKNIFKTHELNEQSVSSILEHTAKDGKKYKTDIYAQCSIDYDPNEEITKQFFATVQNKLHFAISGQTAAEIIHRRVGSAKPNMGLTTWKDSGDGSEKDCCSNLV